MSRRTWTTVALSGGFTGEREWPRNGGAGEWKRDVLRVRPQGHRYGGWMTLGPTRRGLFGFTLGVLRLVLGGAPSARAQSVWPGTWRAGGETPALRARPPQPPLQRGTRIAGQ